MAMDRDYPGYLGWTSKGVIAIHADWPAYPWEHGWDEALLNLGEFPIGTRFRCEEVIDQCCLLVADTFPEQYRFPRGTEFHIAIWNHDIVGLDQRRLVGGVKYEYDLSPDQVHLKRQVGPDLYEQLLNGVKIGVEIEGEWKVFRTAADEETEYDYGWDLLEQGRIEPADHLAIYPHDEIFLCEDAQAQLDAVARSRLQIPPKLQGRILPLLSSGLFDTAIRELGASLEHEMRTTLNLHSEKDLPHLFGHKLIESYMDLLRSQDILIDSYFKTLYTTLKTGMAFVRNDFAHAIADLEPSRGYSLVSRMCRLATVLDAVSVELNHR